MRQTRSFFVPGRPAPKGSTRSFVSRAGKLVTKADCARTKPWQASVALAASAAGIPLVREGVSITLTFRFSRPKSHLKRDGELKPTSPLGHVSKPDVDKLVRAVMDGLTGIAYVDDAQVDVIRASKYYTRSGEPEGLWVEVSS